MSSSEDHNNHHHQQQHHNNNYNNHHHDDNIPHQIHQPPAAPQKDVAPGDVVKPYRPEDPAQAALYKLLGARLRCTLDDGRTATGTFICMDRLKNIILMDVIEEREIDPADYYYDHYYGGATTTTTTNNNDNDQSNTTTRTPSSSRPIMHHRRVPVQRELSQAMIPGKHLAKVEIEKSIFDSKMKSSLPKTTTTTR